MDGQNSRTVHEFWHVYLPGCISLAESSSCRCLRRAIRPAFGWLRSFIASRKSSPLFTPPWGASRLSAIFYGSALHAILIPGMGRRHDIRAQGEASVIEPRLLYCTPFRPPGYGPCLWRAIWEPGRRHGVQLVLHAMLIRHIGQQVAQPARIRPESARKGHPYRKFPQRSGTHPEVSEAMVTLAMIRLMVHRLAHPNRKRLPPP